MPDGQIKEFCDCVEMMDFETIKKARETFTDYGNCQSFLNLYCKEHKKRFGTEFKVSRIRIYDKTKELVCNSN